MESQIFDLYIENGICFGIAKKSFTMTIEIARALVEKRLEVTNGKAYPLYIDFKGLGYADKQVRDYFIAEGMRGVLAGAYIANSRISQIFFNSFIMIYRPNVPARVFTNKQEAIDWLKQFKS